jgi:hypothetical protein
VIFTGERLSPVSAPGPKWAVFAFLLTESNVS